MMSMTHTVRTWTEMIKFSHSVFALPFAVIAAFLAGRHLDPLHRPHSVQLALVVICVLVTAVSPPQCGERRSHAQDQATSGGCRYALISSDSRRPCQGTRRRAPGGYSARQRDD